MKFFFVFLPKTAFYVAERGFLGKIFFCKWTKYFFICFEKDKKICGLAFKTPTLRHQNYGAYDPNPHTYDP